MSDADSFAKRKAMLSSRRAKLSAEEQALLEALVVSKPTPLAGMDTIPRRPSQGPARLSFAQQRLWFVDQWDPGSSVYNVPLCLRLWEQIDFDALVRSLNEIVRRHDVLRTTFTTKDGKPLQIIAPAVAVRLPSVDLEALSQTEQEAEVERLATEEAQWSFDLQTGPLARFLLLHLDAASYALILTVHHIVFDGWSVGVFVQEMNTLYQTFVAGESVPLPEPPIQYADFAIWQREWLQGEALAAQLSYWKKHLRDAPAALELPTDRPRPAVQTYRGATHSFVVPEAVVDGLRALSQEQEATLFMTLLAAFNVLLHRYTGQEDLVVGSPIANRNRPEIEGLIGFFVNMLALRTDLTGNPTFRELLQRVQEVALGAYAHQDLPFEMIVDALALERDLSRTPLFQVVFALWTSTFARTETHGLNLSIDGVDSGTAKFDLTLFVYETGPELRGIFEYNTDLFDAATIARMARHLLVLLQGIATHPDRRIVDLPLLTDDERRQFLHTWNSAPTPYPAHHCLHQLFEQQVERTPDAVALVFETQHLTYRALNRRANQLAHHLHALGVKPEVLVGVCVERSPELPIALLGILKAGGGYVPLHPAYPQERLAFMLADTRAPLLLTQEHLAHKLRAHDVQLLVLDADWPTSAGEDSTNPTSPLRPDNLAYVIYTSGSTGRPKGVLVTHANVCPLLHWGFQHLPLTPHDRAIQFLSYSFDWSVWEMLIVLSSGASLFMITEQHLLDPALARAFIAHHHITVLHATPTQFQLLIAGGERLPTLSHACIGAEKLPRDLLERSHHLLAPGCRIFNMYGPTEVAIVSVALEVDRSHLDRYAHLLSAPIGEPVSNVHCFVLDPHLNPQPVGVPGELYLAGDGVARGYLDRPALTAERFVPHPFSPPHRAYKTGDLVRWLPDGRIEFLDRVDYQVKLRGFRIELGEVETALLQHPAVQEAAVLLREDGAQDKQLVAYLIPKQGSQLATHELRSFLQGQLPPYMLPAAFVTLAEFPLTASGKINRRALPAPDTGRPELAETFVAPRTPVEELVARVWSQVLGLQRVGVTDNFFELGGHSLLAIRLLARIRQELGRQLPLETLFQTPTVEGLAAMLDRHPATIVPSSQLLTLQPGDATKRPLFFVHPAGGSVFCYVDLCRCLGPEQPCYGLQAQGLDGKQEPLTHVTAMAERYVALLRSVQPEGPYALAGWSLGGVIAFEMAQQLQAQEQNVVLLALIDSYVPLDSETSEPSDAAILTNFMLDLGVSPQQALLEANYLEKLEPQDWLGYTLEQAKQANVIPHDVELAQFGALFRVFKSNVRAVDRYIPHPYPGRVTLFKAKELIGQATPGVARGWRPLAAQGLTVHVVPGNHFTMIRPPHVEAWARHLPEDVSSQHLGASA